MNKKGFKQDSDQIALNSTLVQIKNSESHSKEPLSGVSLTAASGTK